MHYDDSPLKISNQDISDGIWGRAESNMRFLSENPVAGQAFPGRHGRNALSAGPVPAWTEGGERPVKITNEQINEEIAELTSQADRMHASAKALFLVHAQLKAQAEHFKRLLELRTQAERHPGLTSYILIGFAREDEEKPKPFCAVTWKGLTAAPSDVRILLTSDWMRVLPSDPLAYFNELLNGWEKMLQTQPETMLAMVAGLSFGPIQTVDQGTMHEERVSLLIQQKLGEVLRFPSSVTPVK